MAAPRRVRTEEGRRGFCGCHDAAAPPRLGMERTSSHASHISTSARSQRRNASGPAPGAAATSITASMCCSRLSSMFTTASPCSSYPSCQSRSTMRARAAVSALRAFLMAAGSVAFRRNCGMGGVVSRGERSGGGFPRGAAMSARTSLAMPGTGFGGLGGGGGGGGRPVRRAMSTSLFPLLTCGGVAAAAARGEGLDCPGGRRGSSGREASQQDAGGAAGDEGAGEGERIEEQRARRLPGGAEALLDLIPREPAELLRHGQGGCVVCGGVVRGGRSGPGGGGAVGGGCCGCSSDGRRRSSGDGRSAGGGSTGQLQRRRLQLLGEARRSGSGGGRHVGERNLTCVDEMDGVRGRTLGRSSRGRRPLRWCRQLIAEDDLLERRRGLAGGRGGRRREVGGHGGRFRSGESLARRVGLLGRRRPGRARSGKSGASRGAGPRSSRGEGSGGGGGGGEERHLLRRRRLRQHRAGEGKHGRRRLEGAGGGGGKRHRGGRRGLGGGRGGSGGGCASCRRERRRAGGGGGQEGSRRPSCRAGGRSPSSSGSGRGFDRLRGAACGVRCGADEGGEVQHR